MKKFVTIFTFCILHFALPSSAQLWSYVYIQGDKQLPFYVKLEDEMMPRYSKNFCIIPSLESGPMQIEILFQQNEYPSQTFNILVPDGSFRGFMLTKKGNDFALYDIYQKFYLMPGATGEDHLLAITGAKKKNPRTQPQTKSPRSRPGSNEPKFIDSVQLNNQHSIQKPESAPPPQTQEQPKAPAEQPAEQEAAVPDTASSAEPTYSLASDKTPVVNPQCPAPMSDVDFETMYTASQDKKDDERRMNYLLDKVGSSCFSTRQVYLLAKQLTAESMRYSFCKKAFPRVSDQQNFHLLENNLFKTTEWKSYFKTIQ